MTLARNNSGPTPKTGLLTEPHHDSSERYVSNPHPSPGETVEVSVEVPADADITDVGLRTAHDGEAAFIEGRPEVIGPSRRWHFELPCRNEIVPYRFRCVGSGGPRWLTGLGTIGHDPQGPVRLPPDDDRRTAVVGPRDRMVPDIPGSLRPAPGPQSSCRNGPGRATGTRRSPPDPEP